MFQLDPPAIASRVRAAAAPRPAPSLAGSLLRGALGFTLVSIAGFAPWVFFGRWLAQRIGEAGLYAVCAVLFIGLSGLLLHRLIMGPGSLARFYKLFSLGFAAYAVAWCVGWMSLRGDLGGAVGLLAGTALMGSVFAHAFEARSAAIKVIAALFLLNALGYFVGGWIEGCLIPMKGCSVMGIPLGRPTQIMLAKLQWGVCYGLGLGAGLGMAFYLCQSRARVLLAEKPADR